MINDEKQMKTDENPWKSIKNYENRWESIKIDEKLIEGLDTDLFDLQFFRTLLPDRDLLVSDLDRCFALEVPSTLSLSDSSLLSPRAVDAELETQALCTLSVAPSSSESSSQLGVSSFSRLSGNSLSSGRPATQKIDSTISDDQVRRNRIL